METRPTHIENCRRVTDWRPSDDGKTRQRWVYDGREECWDEEIEMTATDAPTPICWALLNPRTMKVHVNCYVREVTARAAAERLTNHWTTYVAVPLFLHPDVYTP